jgi:hypothetical protein
MRARLSSWREGFQRRCSFVRRRPGWTGQERRGQRYSIQRSCAAVLGGMAWCWCWCSHSSATDSRMTSITRQVNCQPHRRRAVLGITSPRRSRPSALPSPDLAPRLCVPIKQIHRPGSPTPPCPGDSRRVPRARSTGLAVRLCCTPSSI